MSRKQTLQLIQKVVVEFVKHVSRSKNLPQSSVDTAGGKIFTFGSYRLGVYGPGQYISSSVFGSPYTELKQDRILTHLWSYPNTSPENTFSTMSPPYLNAWHLQALSRNSRLYPTPMYLSSSSSCPASVSILSSHD